MNFKLTGKNVNDCMRLLGAELENSTDIIRESGETVVFAYMDKNHIGGVFVGGIGRDVAALIEHVIAQIDPDYGDEADESELS